jgi:hypothetical protein
VLFRSPEATNFSFAWYGQDKLNTFPAISAPKAFDFSNTWQYCTSLTAFNFYPEIMFKSMLSGANCFTGVTLPTQTWSSILTSCSAFNTNLNVQFGGGNSKRNPAGTTAYSYLTGRGWSISDSGNDY